MYINYPPSKRWHSSPVRSDWQDWQYYGGSVTQFILYITLFPFTKKAPIPNFASSYIDLLNFPTQKRWNSASARSASTGPGTPRACPTPSRASTLTANCMRTASCGWRKVGWISSCRSSIGRRMCQNRATRRCSNGGAKWARGQVMNGGEGVDWKDRAGWISLCRNSIGRRMCPNRATRRCWNSGAKWARGQVIAGGGWE